MSNFKKYKFNKFDNALIPFSLYILYDFILIFFILLALTMYSIQNKYYVVLFILLILIFIDFIFLIKIKQSSVDSIIFSFQGYSIKFNNKIIENIFSISWFHVLLFLGPCIIFLFYNYIIKLVK